MFRSLLVTAMTLGFAMSAASALDMKKYDAEALIKMGFFTQEQLDMEQCKGRFAVLRFNRAHQGGSFDGFAEAAADHRAWMREKGFEDIEIHVFRGTFAGDDEIAFGSLVIYPSVLAADAYRIAQDTHHDEAYARFVAKYGNNTGGFTEFHSCVDDADVQE